MKICIVTSSFPVNDDDSFAAAGKACRDFALELEKQGHEVFVIAPRFSGREAGFGKLKICRFSWGGSGKSLSMLKMSKPQDLLEICRFIYFGRKSCIALLKDEGIDRVMAMWAVPAGLLAFFAKKRLGVTYDVWALGADIWDYGRKPLLKGIVRKVLKSANLLYADGRELCHDVEELCSRQCAFLPHLSKIDFENVEPFDLDEGKYHFLFIGRWEMPKGIDIFIEAVKMLKMENSDFHIHIIGGGSLEGLIRREIDSCVLGDMVTLLGWVDQSVLAAYLKSCHVLVIPSRVESIPCVYSEAMNAGIPVIVTDVGDMGLLTKEYGVGRVALAEDPASLKKEMKNMMSENMEPYIINAAKVAEQWSLPAVVSQYLLDVEGLKERKSNNL